VKEYSDAKETRACFALRDPNYFKCSKSAVKGRLQSGKYEKPQRFWYWILGFYPMCLSQDFLQVKVTLN